MPSPTLAGVIAKQVIEYTTDFAMLRAPYYSFAMPTSDSLPPVGKMRDTFYRMTPYYDGMWANALKIAIAQIITRAWEITGDIPFKVKQGQEILAESEGQEGWGGFLAKLLQDYSLTDNGCFIEIERVANNPNAKIKALWALDSLSCYRTGNAKYPVIYYDYDGARHILADWQVLCLSDTPSPVQSMNNAGICAASNAYKQIYKNSIITRYYIEKISGQRPLAMHFLNNVNPKQLEDAMASARATQRGKGIEQFMGAMIVALLGQDKPELVTVDFASLPDGFDKEKERRETNLVYAGALGFSVDELEPTSGQALGVGAQSQVQKDREKAKGLEVFAVRLTQLFQRRVMPNKTEFHFITKDFDEKIKEANWKLAEVNALIPLVNTQIATGEEVRNLLVEVKALPDSMRVVAQTDQEYSIGDDEANDTLDGEEAPQELPANVEDLTATKAYTVQTGDRGGKFYLDADGNKVYGDPPATPTTALNSDEQEVLSFIQQGDFNPNETGKKTVAGLVSKGLVANNSGKYSVTDAGKVALGLPQSKPPTAPAKPQPKDGIVTQAMTDPNAPQNDTIAKITTLLQQLLANQGTPKQAANAKPVAQPNIKHPAMGGGVAIAEPTTPEKARALAGKVAAQNPNNQYRIQPTGNGQAVVTQQKPTSMPSGGGRTGTTITQAPAKPQPKQVDAQSINNAKDELTTIANKISDTDKDGKQLQADIADLKTDLHDTKSSTKPDKQAQMDKIKADIKAKIAKQAENRRNRSELAKQQNDWKRALERTSQKGISKGLELVTGELLESKKILERLTRG
jgi:hypothetical protein